MLSFTLNAITENDFTPDWAIIIILHERASVLKKAGMGHAARRVLHCADYGERALSRFKTEAQAS